MSVVLESANNCTNHDDQRSVMSLYARCLTRTVTDSAAYKR